jgi:hypothetical protein
MNNLAKRIKRLEKSIQPEPKGPPAFIFANPGESTEQKIAEFEAEHGHFDRDNGCIIRFASEEDQSHDN